MGDKGNVNVDTVTLITLCRKHNNTVIQTLRSAQDARKSDVRELVEVMERTSLVLARCVKDYGDLRNVHLPHVEKVYKLLCEYEKDVIKLVKKSKLARFLNQVRLRSRIDQKSNSILSEAVDMEAALQDVMHGEGIKEYEAELQMLLPDVVATAPVMPERGPLDVSGGSTAVDDVVHDPDTLERLEAHYSIVDDPLKRNEIFESITSFQVKPLSDTRHVYTLSPDGDDDDTLHADHDRAAGLSVNAYPMSLDEPGRGRADPICDQYYATFFPTRSLVTLADGCNWGQEPKEAARKAARMFSAYMNHHMHRIGSTKDASVLMLRAMKSAHRTIIEGRNEETIWVAGTTTMISSVVLELEEPQDRKAYALVLASVGDCKAYCFHARTRKWDEITKSNRGGVDGSDCGGRIGPHIDLGPDPETNAWRPGGPDLRNIIMYNYLVEEGDIVVFVSDGVHDNMDPKLCGLNPSDVGLDGGPDDDWQNVTDLELQERKAMEYALEKLARLCPQPDVSQICRTLCDDALQVTLSSRRWMEDEANRGKKQPTDYKLYPGKMDHTTAVAFKVGAYASEQRSGGGPVPSPMAVRFEAPAPELTRDSSYATIKLDQDDINAIASDNLIPPTLGDDTYDTFVPDQGTQEPAQHAHAFAVWSRLFGQETYIVRWETFIATVRASLSDGLPRRSSSARISRNASVRSGLTVSSAADDNSGSEIDAVEADLDSFAGGQTLDADDEEKLRQVIDNSGSNTVTRFRFFEFLGGFGPISKMLANVRQVITAQWFYGFISSNEAKKFLESHPVGTFLVRFSGTQPGSFVLDYVREMGHVRSVRLRSAGGAQGGLAALTEGTSTRERVFENLHALVETYTKMNILRLPFTSTLPVKPWFYGDVSRDEAQQLLQDQPVGTFLIRFSERAGCFAASFVTNDAANPVKKGLITQCPGGHQVQGKGKVFADLDELVDHYYAQNIFVAPLVSRQEL